MTVKYVSSLYFVIVSMTSTGYGDILPVNYIEYIFVCMLLFISSVIYVYSISAIGSILTSLKLKNKNFIEDMDTL